MTAVRRLAFAEAAGDRLRTGRIRLDPGGPSYSITLDWLPTADGGLGAWSLTLATSSTPGVAGAGKTIVTGALLRDRFDALYGVVVDDRPRGAIIPYNPARRDDPRRFAFSGEGWSLYYVPSGYNPANFVISSVNG